jgi:ATP-binding cassette subfamily F protein uup
MEGDGRATVYAGGWSDYRAQAGERAPDRPKPEPRVGAPKAALPPERPAARPGLSFTQRHRLDSLPAEIDRLAEEIRRLEALLADPELYARDPARFDKATRALAERQAKLEGAETEWLELEELREATG